MLLHDFCHLKCLHEEGLLTPAKNPGGIRESSMSWLFSCLDLKLGFWQIQMEEVSKQYTAFNVSYLGFFKCDHMPFRLCNVQATFQQLMQNCLGKLNLIYCLIYLDDITIFSQTADISTSCA